MGAAGSLSPAQAGFASSDIDEDQQPQGVRTDRDQDDSHSDPSPERGRNTSLSPLSDRQSHAGFGPNFPELDLDSQAARRPLASTASRRHRSTSASTSSDRDVDLDDFSHQNQDEGPASSLKSGLFTPSLSSSPRKNGQDSSVPRTEVEEEDEEEEEKEEGLDRKSELAQRIEETPEPKRIDDEIENTQDDDVVQYVTQEEFEAHVKDLEERVSTLAE